MDRRVRELREEMERFEKMKLQHNLSPTSQEVHPAPKDASHVASEPMEEEEKVTFAAKEDQSTPDNSEKSEADESNDDNSSSSMSSSSSSTANKALGLPKVLTTTNQIAMK